MSRSTSLFRASFAAAATIALVAASALALQTATSNAAGGITLSIREGSPSQKKIATNKTLPVTVSVNDLAPSAGTTVKQVSASATLTRGSTVTKLASSVTIKITAGKGSANLAIGATGRTAIAKCSAGVITVTANGASTSEPLYVDSKTCLGKAPSVDTKTASRCDITDPSVCLYPFPNDYFTTADSSKSSGKRINFKLDSMPATTPNVFAPKSKNIGVDEFNKFDGFSPGSMLITRIPGLTNDAAITRSGLPTTTNIGKYADANQALVVIDASTGQRWPIWAENGQGYSDSAFDKVSSTPEDKANLIIHPARNFTDGHRYIVALRNLKDSTGKAIAPSDGFRLYRDRLVTSNSVVESRRTHMESLFGSLKSAGIDRSNLNLAWDFTVASTRSLSERALKIRNNAFAQLGDTTMGDNTIQGNSPVFHITKVTDTPNDPDTIRQIDGTVEVPCYLDKTGCGSGGKFNYGSDGLPAQINGNKQLARFRCNIPQSAVDGSGPVYMTLYGHGLFGSINEMGSRNVRQLGNAERMLVCGSDWSGMASEDELTAAGILSDLTNFPKMADRLQQGYLNFMFLGRALAHTSGLTTNSDFRISKEGNTASYNTGYIAYYGNSQGGIAGGGLTALSPDITRSILYVGAMNYSLLLTRSVDFDEFKPYFYPNYTKLQERPLLFALMQIMWDRGEPNGYANHITSNPLPDTPVKHVTMEMSYGDHQVANIATEVQARTMGLKVRKPYLDQGRDVNGSISGWGLTTLGSMPLDDNALIVWDIGPYRTPVDASACRDRSSDTWCGTPSPPSGNFPNSVGTDPHDLNIETMATLRHQIAEYIKPNGKLIDVCGGLQCYGAAWTGLTG